MKEQFEDQNYIRSYLLGRLSEDERELFEERIFADPAFFDRVRMTEEELLEDHVFEVLPPDEAERVADCLMRTPEQIQRWQITAALKKYSDRGGKPKAQPPVPVVRTTHSAWTWALAASVLVAVGIGIWVIRATSLERQVASLNTSGQVDNMQSDLALELPALRLRSGPQENTTEPRLNVPKTVTVVQIRLPVEVGSYS
jgi:anti-sigma factor RsiW